MKQTQVRCAIVALLACAGLFLTAGAIPAVVLTNTGQVADGSLSGLGPILRLVRPTERPLVGPDVQFDVPLSSILQITLDFPRVIIETATRTLIGPFSAILGIPEMLRLDRSGSESYDLPTTSLRAIALNGASLRRVPREWTVSEFLTRPKVVAASPLTDTICDDCSIAAPPIGQYPGSDDPIWNTITPTLPPETDRGELPWWVGLLGVAGVMVVLYLMTGSGGTSS
ncbi:hypothetical protein ACFLTM_05390 [Candidatus Bipolaricaulota bacterium]